MSGAEHLGPYLLEVKEGVFPLGGDSLALGAFATVKRGWRVCDLGTGSGCLPSRPDGPEPEGASGQQSVDHGLQPQQIAILIGAAGIVLGMPGRADQERIEFYSDRANPPGQSGGMVYVNEFAVALDKTARKVMPLGLGYDRRIHGFGIFGYFTDERRLEIPVFSRDITPCVRKEDILPFGIKTLCHNPICPLSCVL